MTDLAITAADVRDAAAQIAELPFAHRCWNSCRSARRWDIACW
jgi:hypothetical protein